MKFLIPIALSVGLISCGQGIKKTEQVAAEQQEDVNQADAQAATQGTSQQNQEATIVIAKVVIVVDGKKRRLSDEGIVLWARLTTVVTVLLRLLNLRSVDVNIVTEQQHGAWVMRA